MWLLLMIASTPCSSRSSEGAADVVSALNARFRAGRPSDDPASAGVVVHAIDNRDQARGLALIWRPNTRMGQIVSCSLMNAELPFLYTKMRAWAAGFVLSSAAVKRALLCNYPWDAGSDLLACPTDWRSSDTCVPGCPSARYKEKPGTARWQRARSMEQNAATLARLECSQNASKCKLAAWKNSSSTRPRLSLSQTMILHQRRMAGALSCTGHAVTCSGARPVDHKNFTNEVELKQYNELVLAADTLSASAVEAVYMLPHVALTYAFTQKFKRAFASRQNQSLQKDQEDQTLLARSVHTYLLRYSSRTAQQLPLLELDISNPVAPFRRVVSLI